MPDHDVYARFYDAEYGDEMDDLALYVGFAERMGGPVLELACGTGRLLIPLAKAGYEMTGVDISADMLQRAREKATLAGVLDRITLIQGDIRTFEAPREYSMAFVAVSSFMVFTTTRAIMDALRNVRKHLRSGGIFVIDLFNPDPRLLLEGDGRLILQKEWREGDGTLVQKFVVRRTDFATQIQRVEFVYDLTHPNGCLERLVHPVELRYLWRNEGELLLERAGYVVEAVYGSYDLEPYEDGSPSLIFVARAA